MSELDELIDAEQAFDAHLTRPYVDGSPSMELLRDGERWSQHVWANALASGPVKLRQSEVERGWTILARPIFICGVHRSGTTLLHDLLEGHPAISMLPSEGSFFTSLERRLLRLPPATRQAEFGKEWLRRLANPINRQPYWLLGRSFAQSSPYIEFARSLLAWWPLALERLSRSVTSWPLAAVALAYLHGTGSLSTTASIVQWGEKTPTNERFLSKLQHEFPLGRVVQLIRDPVEVYASRLAIEPRLRTSLRARRRMLAELRLSYQVALEPARYGVASRHRVVRYEDLIRNPQGTMQQLAAFLDIEALPLLLTPTVAGHAAYRNSSFASDANSGSIQAKSDQSTLRPLSRRDTERLAAVVGDAATALGYSVAPLASWKARLLRWV